MEYTEEYIGLKRYWPILRRRWLPAAIVMGSVITLTAAITCLPKPIYQAEGKVLLRKNGGIASSSNSGSNAEEGGNLGFSQTLTPKTNPIRTEIEIIKSEPVLRRTIQSLQLKETDGKGLALETFLKMLSVNNTQDTDIISLAYKSTDPQLAMRVVNRLIEIYREKNLESTRAQASAARKFIESQMPKAEAEVKRYEVAIRDFKERSKVVSLADETKISVESIGRIQEALTNYQGQLADSRSRAQALRNQLGVSSANQGLAVNALSQSPAVQKALADLQEVDRTLATLETQLQPDHPQIQDLKKKQQGLQSFLSAKVGQVVGQSLKKPSLNVIQASETQQKMTETLIQTEVQRLGLENQVGLLKQAQANYRSRATVLPRLEQIQRELERKLAVAQTTYGALLKRLQEISIAENQNVGNIETVALATLPDKPISPKILLNLAIGTVMSLLLGIGTALLLEAIDTSIKTVKEAQSAFDLTVLGTIPKIEAVEPVNLKSLDWLPSKLPVRDDPRSSVSEAYRMLQTNLKFLSSDHPARVITLTSSVPQEGKSMTTANLALVLAEMGHRVLVVDADLRRPSQHQIWELPNAEGLSNILVEPGEWAGVVRSENELLDIITAGVIPPSPLRLIDSHRMVSLIGEWRELYDYVIIDTPPLAVASDALLVGQATDGLLMVARPGVLNSASANAAKATLEKVRGSEEGQARRINLLGLVLNGVIPENEPNGYHYYAAKDYYTVDSASDPVSRYGKAASDFPGAAGSSSEVISEAVKHTSGSEA
jgi:polysaccharide biosynthesis transport protein